MESLCIRCKGKGLCKKPCKILARFIDKAPKVGLNFSGSSPPEVFVGRMNYPNVFMGVLAPNEKGETEILSEPELWFREKLTIEQILENRAKLIYSRTRFNIKSQKSLKSEIQNISLSSSPVSAEFFLKKAPKLEFSSSKIFSIMANPAPVERIKAEENIKVEKKVDYLTSDYDIKAKNALQELYKSKIKVSHIQKLLSAGLLGVKAQRRLVPTRWSITAVDDMLSKFLLERIRYYPPINEISIFHSEYNGNHYEVLLLPESFSFEVIEAEIPGNIWNPGQIAFMTDYEGFHSRKTYASNVTGAYYTNRLAVCEYLERIKRQASVLVLREVREEYYAPLGVGILRELTRDAFNNQEKANNLEEAFKIIQKRLRLCIKDFTNKSWIIKNYGKQKKITNWI